MTVAERLFYNDDTQTEVGNPCKYTKRCLVGRRWQFTHITSTHKGACASKSRAYARACYSARPRILCNITQRACTSEYGCLATCESSARTRVVPHYPWLMDHRRRRLANSQRSHANDHHVVLLESLGTGCVNSVLGSVRRCRTIFTGLCTRTHLYALHPPRPSDAPSAQVASNW